MLTDDPNDRGYLLYSFGPDGEDDGGFPYSGKVSYRAPAGTDIPLN